jgi:ABC-2 type transport system permease protein
MVVQALAPDLKRESIGGWLSLVGSVIRNWYFSWTFFLPDFLVDLAGMFTSAAIFYLMGELVAKGAAAHVAAYGQSYGAYIITGVGFNMLMTATLTSYHNACLYGYWSTQFDTYLQHPGGVSALLTGAVVARYLQTSLHMAVYFAVGADVANLPQVLLILVLAVLAVTGLGLAGASTFSLLNAKGWVPNPIEWLVGFGVTLLGGVYFPPTVLPAWLQRIGEWLPQTHALRAARLCLSGQATLGDPRVAADLAFLAQFTLVALPIGAALFAAGIQKAQRDGTLTRWS